MPTPDSWEPPAGWVDPPWLIYLAGGGTTWIEVTGIGEDGIDYSGQTVTGEFTKRAYGGMNITDEVLPGGPVVDDPEPPVGEHPLAARVAAFLGLGDDEDVLELATAHVGVVEQFARAYTRDNGFTDDGPNEAIASVIVTATARLVGNPEQIGRQIGEVTYRGGFSGWSLAELAVLNRYRKRAQ